MEDNDKTGLSADSFDAVSIESEEYEKEGVSEKKIETPSVNANKGVNKIIRKRPETGSKKASTIGSIGTSTKLPTKKKNRKAIYEKKFQD